MTNQRFNPDLVRAAINVLAESEPHLAAEVESLLAASNEVVTIAIRRNEEGDLFTTADVRARVIFIDESQNFGSFEEGDADVYSVDGNLVRATVREACPVTHKVLLESIGLKPSLLPDAVQPASPWDIDDMIFVPNAEVRQALIAALFYWRQMGMCEPNNRSDGIHALATGNDEFTSASEEDIDRYLLRLYAEHDPVEHLRNLRVNLEGYDQVVIKIEGGLVAEVFASGKIEVMILDHDTEGAEDDDLVEIDDAVYIPSTADIKSGELVVDPAFCARVKQALTAFYS